MKRPTKKNINYVQNDLLGKYENRPARLISLQLPAISSCLCNTFSFSDIKAWASTRCCKVEATRLKKRGESIFMWMLEFQICHRSNLKQHPFCRKALYLRNSAVMGADMKLFFYFIALFCCKDDSSDRLLSHSSCSNDENLRMSLTYRTRTVVTFLHFRSLECCFDPC